MIIARTSTGIERHLVPLHAGLGITIPVHGRRGLEDSRCVSRERAPTGQAVGEGPPRRENGLLLVAMTRFGLGSTPGKGGFFASRSGLGSAAGEDGFFLGVVGLARFVRFAPGSFEGSLVFGLASAPVAGGGERGSSACDWGVFFAGGDGGRGLGGEGVSGVASLHRGLASGADVEGLGWRGGGRVAPVEAHVAD